MAIVIAGLIGGVVVGIIGGAASYEDHSDHSDYNDAAVRRREEAEARRKEAEARKEREEAERREARQELTSVIRKNVNSFRRTTGIGPEKNVTASQCQFNDFDADMQPMNSSVETAIDNDLAQDKKDQMQEAKKKLEQIDQAILTINEKILNKNQGN